MPSINLLPLLFVLTCFKHQYSLVDPCSNLQCANGGICMTIETITPRGKEKRAVCKCAGNWSGIHCDMSPCFNNIHICNNGTCLTSEDGTAECCCPAGCNGPHCDQNDDICTKLGGECKNNESGDVDDLYGVPCCNGLKCCINGSSVLLGNPSVQDIYNELIINREEITQLQLEIDRLQIQNQDCNRTTTPNPCIPELLLCRTQLNDTQNELDKCRVNVSECQSEIVIPQTRLQRFDDLLFNATQCRGITSSVNDCNNDPNCKFTCVANSLLATDLFNNTQEP